MTILKGKFNYSHYVDTCVKITWNRKGSGWYHRPCSVWHKQWRKIWTISFGAESFALMTAFSWSYWCSRMAMSTNIVKWREGIELEMVKNNGQSYHCYVSIWCLCLLMAIWTSHKFQWWQRLELLIISLSDDTLGLLCGNISPSGLMKLKIQ